MVNRCPGQDSRKVHPETIICGHCGYAAEIFSDELKIKCAKCLCQISRSVLPSCLDWCKSARDCLGREKWEQRKNQSRTTKNRR